jgi:hypothetical protein
VAAIGARVERAHVRRTAIAAWMSLSTTASRLSELRRADPSADR